VGPPQYLWLCRADQGPGRRFRRRRCLLKGCEQPFRPCHPQCRYCSEACQQKARYWRRWYASQRYRASAQGKERRRAQSRRYRERVRQRVALALAAGEEVSAAESAEPREGQRPGKILGNFGCRPCRRPGCYEVFAIKPRSPAQQFCTCQCRRALRRVLDREAHWRRRHRHPGHGQRPAARSPPKSG
jgi:hypothetical protein